MGNPDGGWYDDTPPHVVSASPAEGSVNVKGHKVVINFSEFIKIEDAQNKVIVSPPQLEQAEIKASGKRIIVELKDSLKPETTYTVDFSDAISDNNEGNPMGNYTYSFSTGDHIDTMEVSGYCLNAENLEPIKGMLVGLYPADSVRSAADSIFHRTPFIRISRSNGSGRFSIKGVAPGSYFAFALQDADGDYVFSQKSEMIGCQLNDTIRPTWKPDVRQDTVWRDSLHIANILRVPYTHFLPDDVTLLCYQELQTDRMLLKCERSDPQRFTLYFTYGSDSLPVIEPMNFAGDSAFIIEASERRDTVTYWLRDTLLVNQDTLRFSMTYMMTDTLGQLVSQTDTLEALAKTSYEKRLKERQKEYERWAKEQEKKRKHDQPYDSVMPTKKLIPKLSAGGQMDPLQRLHIDFAEPLSRCDTAAVHLSQMIDSVWYPVAHEIIQTATRRYEIVAEWQEGHEYSLEIDSAAFEGIYGLVNAPIHQPIKVREKDEYSSLAVEISPNPVRGDTVARIVVQLLDSSDKIVRQQEADAKGVALFPFLKASTYYMRAYIDRNGNGQWDTGAYDADRRPEDVYYHPEEIECKAKWDVQRQWNLTHTPRHLQKPGKITKQKPDKEKQLRNRNLERARQLGIKYLNEQGVRP